MTGYSPFTDPTTGNDWGSAPFPRSYNVKVDCRPLTPMTDEQQQDAYERGLLEHDELD